MSIVIYVATQDASLALANPKLNLTLPRNSPFTRYIYSYKYYSGKSSSVSVSDEFFQNNINVDGV